MPKTEEAVLDEQAIVVFEWRFQWLRHGGFGKRNARLLAESDVDWRYANTLLKNAKAKGFDQKFVMDLLL